MAPRPSHRVRTYQRRRGLSGSPGDGFAFDAYEESRSSSPPWCRRRPALLKDDGGGLSRGKGGNCTTTTASATRPPREVRPGRPQRIWERRWALSLAIAGRAAAVRHPTPGATLRMEIFPGISMPRPTSTHPGAGVRPGARPTRRFPRIRRRRARPGPDRRRCAFSDLERYRTVWRRASWFDETGGCWPTSSSSRHLIAGRPRAGSSPTNGCAPGFSMPIPEAHGRLTVGWCGCRAGRRSG